MSLELRVNLGCDVKLGRSAEGDGTISQVGGGWWKKRPKLVFRAGDGKPWERGKGLGKDTHFKEEDH